MPRALLALCAAVISLAAFLIAAPPASAGTTPIYVFGDGHDVSDCGSYHSACRTIQYALDNIAPSGATIAVGDGTYTDSVMITSDITITNDPLSAAPDIQAPITVGDGAATPAVTISNLGFSLGGSIDVDDNAGSTILTGNKFNDVTGPAIALTGSGDPNNPISATVSANTGSVQAGALPITSSPSVSATTNGVPNTIQIDDSSVQVTGSPASMTTDENPNTLSVSAATGTDLDSASLDVAVTTDASSASSPIAVTADPSGGTSYTPVTLSGSNGSFGGSLTSASPFATTDSLTPSIQLSAVAAPSGTTTVTFNLDQLDGGQVLNTVATKSFSPSLIANSPPVAADQSVTVPFNTATPITLSASDPDPQDTVGNWQVDTGPAHGSTSTSGNVVTYTPNSGYSGTDSFTFTADDGVGKGGTSNDGTVSITVSQDTKPVANDITVNDLVPLNSTGVHIDLSQGTPGESGLTYHLDTTGTRGAATLTNADAKYVPPTTGGTDSFTYWADDGTTTSDHKTVSLTVDSAPVMSDPSSTTVAHYTGSTATSVPITFSATDAQAMSYSVTTSPAHGTATPTTGGTFTYTPTAGYTGTDSFVVTADDGLGGKTPATAHISVTDQPPVNSTPAQATISANSTTRTIQLAAHDPDSGDSISFAKTSGPSDLSINSTSGLVTVGTAEHSAFDFGYTVTSALTGSPQPVAGMMHVLINTPPSATAQTVPATAYHTTVTGTVAATDANSDPITNYQRVVAPAHAAYFHFFPSTHSFTYTPANGYAGADSFTFEAFDGLDWSAPSRVNFTVNKASTSLSMSMSVTRPTSADQPIATVRVTSPGNETGGVVTIKTGGFGTPSKKVVNGLAKITLPQFPGGAQSITAVYGGTPTTTTTSKQLDFTVTKVASKIAFKTSPAQLTTTSNATATVTVTAGPFRPSGGTVTIDENGNRLAQGTPKVGVVSLRLPQFTLGQHNLTVSYTGTASIATSSVIETERVSLG